MRRTYTAAAGPKRAHGGPSPGRAAVSRSLRQGIGRVDGGDHDAQRHVPRARAPGVTPDPYPDRVDPAQSGPGAERRSLWIRRAWLTALAVYVALALANVFGQAAASSTAHGPAATLAVTAPTTLRGGLLYQVKVRVEAHAHIADARLVFDTGWFDGITMNGTVPQPSSEWSRDGRPVLQLGRMQPGATSTLFVEFQVNPTTVAWERRAGIELDDGASRLVTLDRTLTILP
jgi:hypothetical protein